MQILLFKDSSIEAPNAGPHHLEGGRRLELSE